MKRKRPVDKRWRKLRSRLLLLRCRLDRCKGQRQTWEYISHLRQQAGALQQRARDVEQQLLLDLKEEGKTRSKIRFILVVKQLMKRYGLTCRVAEKLLLKRMNMKG